MDTPKETYRVTYSGKKWIVELDGCARPVGSFRTKRDALKHILKVANDASASVCIVDKQKTKSPVKTATYIAILEKDEDSDYSVWFPDFPGCITAGSTLEEAKDMSAEALAFMIEGMIEDAEPVPHPSTLDAVMEDPFASLGLPFLVTVPAPPAKSNRINVTLPTKRSQAVNERGKKLGGSPCSIATPDQKTQANPLPEVETIALPAEGFVRLRTVLQVIPVSQSTWYKGVAEGRFPEPKPIPGMSAKLYNVSDIRELMAHIREDPQANPLPEIETIALPAEGFVRLRTVLQVIPLSQSTWYKGVAEGHFPKPQQIPGTSNKLYNVADIRAFIERIREGA